MSSQTVFVTAGKTSFSHDVALVQKAAATSPGDPITGLAFNTSSFTAYYRIPATGTLTAITLATQTVGGAYSSGGFVEVSSTNDPGGYRFDVPNAVLATAGVSKVVFNGAANMATHTVYYVCLAVDLFTNAYLPANVTYWNSSVLSAKTGAFPGLAIQDSGTAQAGAATTITLRSGYSTADNIPNGQIVSIVGGTGIGQARYVTGYVNSTKVATIDPAWTTNPDSSSVYELLVAPPSPTTSIPAVNTTQFAGQAITAAAGVTIPSSIASPTNITAGTITTVTNLTNAPTAGDLTATMKTSVATAAGNASYLKNTAAADIAFVLVDSTDHVTRKTGITVTAQRSLDHAAFGSSTGTVTEVGNGVYVLSASAADMNANNIVFRFTGAACDPVELHIKTYT